MYAWRVEGVDVTVDSTIGIFAFSALIANSKFNIIDTKRVKSFQDTFSSYFVGRKVKLLLDRDIRSRFKHISDKQTTTESSVFSQLYDNQEQSDDHDILSKNCRLFTLNISEDGSIFDDKRTNGLNRDNLEIRYPSVDKEDQAEKESKTAFGSLLLNSEMMDLDLHTPFTVVKPQATTTTAGASNAQDRARIKQLESQLLKLQSEHSRCSHVQSQVASLTEKCNAQTAENVAANEALAARETALSEVSSEYSRLKHQISSLTVEMSELQSQMSSLSGVCSGKTAEISALDAALLDKEAALSVALAEVVFLKQRTSAFETICAEKDAELLAAHALTAAGRVSLAGNEARSQSLLAQLAEQEAMTASHHSTLRATETKVQRLQQQIQDMESEASKDSAGLSTLVAELRQKLSDSDENVERLTEQNLSLSESKTALEVQLVAASDLAAVTAAAVAAEREGLLASITALTEQVESLTSQLGAQEATADDAATRAKVEIDQLKEALMAAETELSSALVKASELTTKADSLQQEQGRMTELLSSGDAELRQKLANSEGNVEQLKGEISSLSEAKTALEAQIVEASVTAAAVAAEKEGLLASITTLTEQVESLTSQLGAQEATADDASTRAKAEIDQLKAALLVAETGLSSARDAAKELATRVEGFEREHGRMTELLSSRDAELRLVTAALKTATESADISTLDASVAAAAVRGKLVDMEAELAELRVKANDNHKALLVLLPLLSLTQAGETEFAASAGSDLDDAGRSQLSRANSTGSMIEVTFGENGETQSVHHTATPSFMFDNACALSALMPDEDRASQILTQMTSISTTLVADGAILAKLRTSIISLNSHVVSQKDELNSALEKVAELQATLQSATDAHRLLEIEHTEQLDRVASEKGQLDAVLTEARAALDEKNFEIDRYIDLVTCLNAQLSAKSTDLSSMMSHLSALDSVLNETSSTTTSGGHKSGDNLSSAVAAALKAAAAATAEASSEDHTAVSTEESNSKRLTLMNETLSGLKTSLESRSEALRVAQSQITELQNSLAELQSSDESSQSEHKAQIQSLQNEVKSLKATAQSQDMHFKATFESLSLDAEIRATELQHAREELQARVAEIVALQETIAELTKAKEKVAQALTSLQQEMSHAQQTASQEVSGLSVQLAEATTSRDTLQSEYSALLAKHESIASVQRLELENVMKMLDSKTMAVTEAEIKVGKCANDLELQKKKYVEQITQLMDQLEQQSSANSAQQKALNNKIAELERNLAAVEQERKTRVTSAASVTSRVATSATEEVSKTVVKSVNSQTTKSAMSHQVMSNTDKSPLAPIGDAADATAVSVSTPESPAPSSTNTKPRPSDITTNVPDRNTPTSGRNTPQQPVTPDESVRIIKTLAHSSDITVAGLSNILSTSPRRDTAFTFSPEDINPTASDSSGLPAALSPKPNAPNASGVAFSPVIQRKTSSSGSTNGAPMRSPPVKTPKGSGTSQTTSDSATKPQSTSRGSGGGARKGSSSSSSKKTEKKGNAAFK